MQFLGQTHVSTSPILIYCIIEGRKDRFIMLCSLCIRLYIAVGLLINRAVRGVIRSWDLMYRDMLKLVECHGFGCHRRKIVCFSVLQVESLS